MTYNYPSAGLILPKEMILSAKNVLNRSICYKINKSALSRVLHVTYFISCSKKANFGYVTKASLKTQHFQYALSPKRAR